MTGSTWAVITGEYPPQPGGVSDYTREVALGLAKAGDQVHVWAPATDQPTPEEGGVQVHRLAGGFGMRGLSIVSAALAQLPDSTRILVQYVPQAYGWKGMNVPFCLWLARRRLPVWVLYHEVAYPFQWSQRPHRNVLAVVTRAMAWIVANAATRIFVSIPSWISMLPRGRSIEWLPIPSTIPTSVNAEAVAAVRNRLAPAHPEGVLIGHFGTYGVHIAPLLHEILPVLLMADPRRSILLLGGGGLRFQRRFADAFPQLASRIAAPGVLPAHAVSTHLAACDLVIQPYADGVSARRTSMMAGLALGLPILTTAGHLTESLWAESGAVGLVPAFVTKEFLREAEALLGDPARLKDLGSRAAALYRDRFDLSNTLRVLRA